MEQVPVGGCDGHSHKPSHRDYTALAPLQQGCKGKKQMCLSRIEEKGGGGGKGGNDSYGECAPYVQGTHSR